MNVRELIVAYLKEHECDGLRRGLTCVCMTGNPFTNCPIFADNGMCEPFRMAGIEDEDEQDAARRLRGTPREVEPSNYIVGTPQQLNEFADVSGQPRPFPETPTPEPAAPTPTLRSVTDTKEYKDARNGVIHTPPVPLAQPAKRPAFLAKERCQVCGVEKTGLYMTNCMVCGTRVCRSCSEEIEDDVPMCPACAGKAREAKK